MPAGMTLKSDAVVLTIFAKVIFGYSAAERHNIAFYKFVKMNDKYKKLSIVSIGARIIV